MTAPKRPELRITCRGLPATKRRRSTEHAEVLIDLLIDAHNQPIYNGLPQAVLRKLLGPDRPAEDHSLWGIVHSYRMHPDTRPVSSLPLTVRVDEAWDAQISKLSADDLETLLGPDWRSLPQSTPVAAVPLARVLIAAGDDAVASLDPRTREQLLGPLEPFSDRTVRRYAGERPMVNLRCPRPKCGYDLQASETRFNEVAGKAMRHNVPHLTLAELSRGLLTL